METEIMSININELKRCVNYNPDNGLFTNLINRGKSKKGKIIGHINLRGYVQIRLNMKMYWAHRLAWFYTYEVWPTNLIDHINNIKSDNRILNLREATMSQNKMAQGITKGNKSGYKGVFFMKNTGKWKATCTINNKSNYIGTYDTPKEAFDAYNNFISLAHGKYYFNSAGTY